ncbi:MAG: phosphatidylserine/phosphatidylglycerophosphate/cardiolipin synthase family protein, partial [Deltaproteobacteria bacterium]|nr:phosphatidylserine/phosphatidylglycerophosphate/cardiolipin synthase family protein [Deltaproteobacteria bacterium]
MRLRAIASLPMTLVLVGCAGSCDAPEVQRVQREIDRGRAQAERVGTSVAREARHIARADDDEHPAEKAAPPPPRRTGNRAKLLTNGEASFLERMRLIDSAERSIFIQTLIFKADAVGLETADRLIRRKRARPDLDVRVIVDAFANIQDYDAQMLYFELMDAGIEVQGYEPLYLQWVNEIDTADWAAGNKRYHEKYFVVDGRVAIVGGMNIADEYARFSTDPTLIWRGQDVYLEGPIVGDVERAFRENFAGFRSTQRRRPRALESDVYWEAWRTVHPRLRGAVTSSMGRDRAWARPAQRRAWDASVLERRRVESPLRQNVAVSFVRSRPRLGERWIDRVYRERIGSARRSIVIANAYFIPTPELKAALLAAARRGVAITIITNSKETNDIPLINDAGRVSYRELMAAGIAVYRAREGTLHAKLAVFDSEVAIIGSYNLDPRSLALNSEDVVVVEDAGLATELHTRV